MAGLGNPFGAAAAAVARMVGYGNKTVDVDLSHMDVDAGGNVLSVKYKGHNYQKVENSLYCWRRIWYALLGFKHPQTDNSTGIIRYDNPIYKITRNNDGVSETMPHIYTQRFEAFMKAMCFDMQHVTATEQVMMIALICVMPHEIYRMFYAYCGVYKSEMGWFYNIIPKGMEAPPDSNTLTWDKFVMGEADSYCYLQKQPHLRFWCAIIVQMTKDNTYKTIDSYENFRYFEYFDTPFNQSKGDLGNILPWLSAYAMPALAQLCFNPRFEQVLTLINNNAWLKRSSLSASEWSITEIENDPQVDKPAVGSFTYNNQAGVTDGAERVLHSAKRVGNAVFYENNVLLGTLGKQETYAVDTACSTLVVSGCGLNANTMFEPSTSAILLFMRTIVHSRFARTDGHDSRSRSKTAWFSRVLLLTS